METIIERNKTQIETAQNKINEYCTNGFKQCDDICKDRMNLIENRIETLRIENSKYAFELKQKSEEIYKDLNKKNFLFSLKIKNMILNDKETKLKSLTKQRKLSNYIKDLPKKLIKNDLNEKEKEEQRLQIGK